VGHLCPRSDLALHRLLCVYFCCSGISGAPIMTFSHNTYDWWKAQVLHQRDPRNNPEPELEVGVAYPGIYRWRTRRGFVPVQIWRSDEGTLQTINGKTAYADEQFCENVFSWCCRNAITKQQLDGFLLSKHWFDEPAPVVAQPGSNLPENFVEAMRLRLEGEKDEIERFLKEPVDNQERADKAANWAARLIREVRDPVEEMSHKEKQPYLDEARSVDQTYVPIRDLAASLVKRLKEAPEAWMKAEKRRLVEVELQRAAAENACRNHPVLTASNRQPYVERVNAKAGTVGSRTSLREVRSGVIENAHEFAEWLIGVQHPDFIACQQEIANKLARAKTTAPGMRIHIEEKAR
jgi:hypothetical protein